MVRAEEKLDGKHVILATDPSLSAEDVALGYKQLAEVERAFRTMKSRLDLRPLRHRLEDRIRSHVLLCWLGLLLVRVIENETGMTWGAIREEVDEVMVTRLRSKDGRVEMVTELTEGQRDILKKLEIKVPKRVRKVTSNLPAA